QGPGGSVQVVDHVPHHAVRDWLVICWSIHSHCHSAAAAGGRRHPPTHTGKTEVVSQDWNACFSHAAYERLRFLHLLGALRSIRRMSCQCAGSRFSMAVSTRPASSMSWRSFFSSSTAQSF